MATNPNYTVNYDDKRFTDVEADKKEALTQVENTYGNMINESDKYYQAQIDASKQWADTQSQLQQEKTDFAIEQIEQQKDKAHGDYIKEQSGAYVDWQKQSNEYGSNAEKMASAGLDKTGFSESSQVSMYNTYQNRVMTAREVFAQATLNYDNAIKDARLQNNAVLAEIAYQSLQQQTQLALEGFQYKNQLITEQTNKKLEVDNMYWNRYQDVLNQVNTENAMKEEVRQFNMQYEENIRQFNLEYEQQKKEFQEQIRQFNEEIAVAKENNRLEAERLEMQKQEAIKEQQRWEEEMKLKREQLEEEKRQFDKLHPTRTYTGSGGDGGDGGGRVNIKAVKELQNKGVAIAKAAQGTAQSIAKLGYGPLTANALADGVNRGKVSYTNKNGNLTFSRTNDTLKAGQAALNKYTWLK